MELFDEWKFLAGLGIFMFGMFMMEESIKLLAGRSFKTLIRRYAGTRIKGLIAGIISTAILQSSSAVSLMVLAFVGAGLMTLSNAVAVIMGAKVGTTTTAWIVAIFGFKFKIDAFALPLIGIGGLGLIFLSKAGRFVNISKLLAAFGFLFLGLDFMKTSIETLAASIDLSSLPVLGLWVYVLAGILLTAIMQSSSATIAVILTTLFSGVIDFPQAAAMVIGANVGTTVTVLLGAIGGIPAKKQAAASSLVFNLGTAVVILSSLPLVLWLINDVFNLSENAVLGIATFHTLFNILGVIIFFPAISMFVRYLKRVFPEKRTVLTRFILNTTPQVPEAAIEALRKEVLNQLWLLMVYVARRYRLNEQSKRSMARRAAQGPATEGVTIEYDDLERLHAEIFAFYARIQTYEIDSDLTARLEPVIRSSRSIMNATQNFHELLSEIDDIGREDNPFMTDAFEQFKDRLKQLRTMVEKVAGGVEGDESVRLDLARFFESVEAADKQFIASCAKAVTKGVVREQQVTRLLMANRFFTQSSRMLVLSMQALVGEAAPPQPGV
jgi:phosphate:Na+ symporter